MLRCSSDAESEKYVNITRLPKVLCLHLHRRVMSATGMHKDSQFVRWVVFLPDCTPLRSLSLSLSVSLSVACCEAM